jgi:hypothetical protein
VGVSRACALAVVPVGGSRRHSGVARPVPSHCRLLVASHPPQSPTPPIQNRFKRGYRNVINKGIELNQAGEDCQLMMETSGHGALKENM